MNRIKCLRKSRVLSQAEFAELFHVDQTAVSNWETNKNSIDIKILEKIADYFKVPIEFIIGKEFDIQIPISNWTEDKIEEYRSCKGYEDLLLFKYGNGFFKNNIDNPTTIESNVIHLDKNLYYIPLYETVSAGFGAYANDCIIDHQPLLISTLAEAKNTICVKVQGDSMYPKIEDGDIIQVHKQDIVDSGMIAVVLLDDENALVKKMVYGDGWLELQSINPMYKTMRFEGPEIFRVHCLGLVKKIIKNV